MDVSFKQEVVSLLLSMIKYDFLLKTYDSYSLTKEVVLDITTRFAKERLFLIKTPFPLHFIIIIEQIKQMQKTSYGQARLSIIPIRAKASHSSEMVSQLLYNETYTILKEQEEWLYIECLHDAYQGWIAENQVYYISQEIFDTPFKRYNDELIEWDQQLEINLFMGSPFYDVAPNIAPPIERICHAAQQFLNSPYLWGGRTGAGVDCSGLVQAAFRMGHILLPRDASQQAGLGKVVAWGKHKRGDLAFFKNKEDKITHVGLLLSPDFILHASAWVRIDAFNATGIFHKNTATHQLAFIKRMR